MVHWRKRRAIAAVRGDWFARAEALLAGREDLEHVQNSFLVESDIGDVHQVAGAAISLFVRARDSALVDVHVDSRILRVLIIGRKYAAADEENAHIYKKTLALEQQDDHCFCTPDAILRLFLPIAKRLFSLPAIKCMDDYVDLTHLTQGKNWQQMISTIVARFFTSDPALLQAHSATIASLVTNGICSKFVRILVSIQFRRLYLSMRD
jgi:hypothetical protein